MPGRRVVDGRVVANENRGVSWYRAVLLGLVALALLATNPANEATTARILERFRLNDKVGKWTNRRFSSAGNSYWNRRTTNYLVATVKERVTGLEVGAAGRSFAICSFESPDWGLGCRKLRALLSHPGVEWWRLPMDQPPVVLHRLMLLLIVTFMAVACHVPIHDDPLMSMFVPPPQQNPFLWLCQVFVDSNLLLYPVWERLFEVTTLQATTSPCRIAGNDDALNFYDAFVVLVITAAGVRLLTGHAHQNGWMILLVTVMGYWQGTQQKQQQQAIIFEDPTRAESDLLMWMWVRLLWFVVANGLANVSAVLVTACLAFLSGAAWGDYHYNQQVWQVWTQSWSKMIDDTLAQLFRRIPDY